MTRLAIRLGLVVLGVLALGIWQPRETEARVAGCRHDPLVLLSDGVKMHLIVDIGVPAKEVQRVTYTVHAPRGTRMVRVWQSNGLIGRKELVLFKDDLTTPGYLIETLVETARPTTTRAIDFAIDTATGAKVKDAAHGQSGQPVVVRLAKP